MYWNISWLFCIMVGLVACSQPQQSEPKVEYPQMKQMVLDVLHTAEGKKAFQDILKEPDTKKELILDDQLVEKTIQKTFSDPKMKPQLEKILAKPEVAESYIKATEKEQEKLMKALMKDPDYQKSMMDILKDPEFSKQLLQVLNSQEYRKEVMKVIAESLQVPTIKEKLMKLSKEQQEKEQQESQGAFLPKK
jgi:spore germination protein D